MMAEGRDRGSTRVKEVITRCPGHARAGAWAPCRNQPTVSPREDERRPWSAQGHYRPMAIWKKEKDRLTRASGLPHTPWV